jgi:hypothetical protein
MASHIHDERPATSALHVGHVVAVHPQRFDARRQFTRLCGGREQERHEERRQNDG